MNDGADRMTKRLTATEGVTLLARGVARTAAEMMAEAKQVLDDWDRSRPTIAFDQQTLFGGTDDLDAAGDLILDQARTQKLKLWGRPGRRLSFGELPARELIAEQNLSEAVAINLLRNELVPDDRVNQNDQAGYDAWRGARRVQYFDLQVEESMIKALMSGDSEKSSLVKAKRQHNGRNYKDEDAPLIQEMNRLIEDGKATSAEDAARVVVDRASGNGTTASKVTRLSLRFREAPTARS